MRLIDADEAKKLEHMLTLKPSERALFRLMLDRMPTYEPPNPPLTLAELREMDGEPVWVADLLIPDCSCYRFTQKIDGHVLLMEPHYYPAEDVMIPHYCADDENQGYGQTWLGYRRKPEERMT